MVVFLDLLAIGALNRLQTAEAVLTDLYPILFPKRISLLRNSQNRYQIWSFTWMENIRGLGSITTLAVERQRG